MLIVLLLLMMMISMMTITGYFGYQKFNGEDPFDFLGKKEEPIFVVEVVDGETQFTRIEPSDCKGDTYVKKKECSRNGVILNGSEGKCGAGKEEWILDPNAPGFTAAIGSGACPIDYRDCDVPCDKPCQGNSWIEGACMRDGVVLDGSNGDKCGRGMRTYTLDENAPDYEAAVGRGVCTKDYSSACDVECPPNVVAPPSCVYSSTWQKSANGCVVSKDDNASVVGYDQAGWQEKFKLALEAENCTGEKRLSEWETCKGPPAPVNCEGTWGANDGWGPCIGSCGTQPSQIRTYTVTKEAANGGTSCPYTNGEVETRNCGSVVTCPVDCEGRWIDVACPTACGTAATTVNKTWYTSTYPQGTGKACPAPDDPEAQKSCPATASCPWVKSGECRADGTQLYTRGVVNNGDATSKTENCCYEGNEWRNITCNPDNSVVQRKTLVNCSKPYEERTAAGACNYQKCSVQTWKHGNFTSHSWTINDSLPDVRSTGSRDNEISSYAKYGNCKATAYEHQDYLGWAHELQEGRHGLPGGGPSTNRNDKIRSIKIEHLPYNL